MADTQTKFKVYTNKHDKARAEEQLQRLASYYDLLFNIKVRAIGDLVILKIELQGTKIDTKNYMLCVDELSS